MKEIKLDHIFSKWHQTYIFAEKTVFKNITDI